MVYYIEGDILSHSRSFYISLCFVLKAARFYYNTVSKACIIILSSKYVYFA